MRKFRSVGRVDPVLFGLATLVATLTCMPAPSALAGKKVKESPVPATPTITAPVDGATVNTAKPTITASTYSGLSAQKASQWQIDTVNTFNSGLLIDSGTDRVHLNSYTPRALPDGDYYVRVRYQDAHKNWSSWSPPTRFTVKTI